MDHINDHQGSISLGGAINGKYSQQIRQWEEVKVWVFIHLVLPDGPQRNYKGNL